MERLVSTRIMLETLTPLHVGSGREAQPGLDYVELSDGSACVIDFFTVIRHPRVVRECQVLLEKGDVERIAECVARIADTDKSLCLRVARRAGACKTFVALNAGIVPGSSLKGAIRTAILEHLLSRIDARKLEALVQEALREATSPRVGSRRRLLVPGEYIENRVLRAPRPSGGRFDVLQGLIISDPLSMEGVEYAIYELQVHHVDKGVIATACHEFLEPGARLEYSIVVTHRIYAEAVSEALERIAVVIAEASKRARRVEPRQLQDILGVQEALQAVQGLLDRVKLDWVMVEEALTAHAKRVASWELGLLGKLRVRVADEYRRLLEQVAMDGRVDGCPVVRLGFATGHVSKTVMGLLEEKTPKTARIVREFVSNEIGRTWDSLTLKLVDTGSGLYGAGWGKVCRV